MIPTRFLNYLWALAWGYVWQPCDNCGRMFGGHEVGARRRIGVWSAYAIPTCSNPECVKEVQEHNERLERQ